MMRSTPVSLAVLPGKRAEQNAFRWNVQSEAGRSLIPAESKSAAVLALSSARVRDGSPVQSELEEQVISLFDELRDPLLRYTISFGLSGHDGEEIVQETFLALFQHLRQERCRRNLRGWLFRVAHNLALKRLSSNDRRRDRSSLSAEGSENHIDGAANPEEQAAANQRQVRLLAVLQSLPEQDQNCLRLRAEGLRYREIAEVLGISLGSISASLARSLVRLGRAYER
jgi:RNA polymerase sigma-70 factor (ECF subfamily)